MVKRKYMKRLLIILGLVFTIAIGLSSCAIEAYPGGYAYGYSTPHYYYGYGPRYYGHREWHGGYHGGHGYGHYGHGYHGGGRWRR
jgi:hypothetical protein